MSIDGPKKPGGKRPDTEDWDRGFDALHDDGNFIVDDGGSDDDYEGLEIEGIDTASLETLASAPIELDIEPSVASGEITTGDSPWGSMGMPPLIPDDDAPLPGDDPFELGPAGGLAEVRKPTASDAFELGAAGSTPESALRAAEEFFAEDEVGTEVQSAPPSPPVQTGKPPASAVDEFYADIEIAGSGKKEVGVRRFPTVNVVRRDPAPVAPAPAPAPRPVAMRAPAEDEFDDIEGETKVLSLSKTQLAELRSRATREEEPAPKDHGLPVELGDEEGLGVFAPSDEDIDHAIDDLFSFADGPTDGGLGIPQLEGEPAPVAEIAAEPEPLTLDAPTMIAPVPLLVEPEVERPLAQEPELDEPIFDFEDEEPPAAAATAPVVLQPMLARELETMDEFGVTIDEEMPVRRSPTATTITRAYFDDEEDDELESLHTGVFVVNLEEADVSPELPPSPYSDDLPDLGLERLALADLAEASLEDRTEAAARDLLLYERELELVDEPAPALRLRLEAARLAFRVEDYDRAMAHYEGARDIDANCIEAIRGLRRVAVALGDWSAALNRLDEEMPLCSPIERRGLAAYRADILAALGERDRARAAVDELLEEASSDTRALLLRLELALLEDDAGSARDSMEALCRYLSDAQLVESLSLARAALASDRESTRAGLEDALGHPGLLVTAALAAAPTLEAQGEWGAAAATWARAAREGLEEVEPELAGVLLYRAALAAARAEDADLEWQSLTAAVRLLPYDFIVHRGYAAACARRGDHEAAARAFQHLAAIAPCDADRASALTEAAQHWELLAPETPDAARVADEAVLSCYRDVVALDPNDRRAVFALEQRAERLGDVDQWNAIERVIDETATDDAAVGSLYARVRIAQRLIAAGRYEEAAADLGAVHTEVRSPLVTRLLDRALTYAGRFEERARLLAETADAESQWLAPEVGLERAARAAEDVVNYRLLVEAESAQADDDRAPAREMAVLGALSDAIRGWNAVVELGTRSKAAHLALLSLCQRYAYRTGEIEQLVAALATAREGATTTSRATQLALKQAAILLGQDNDDAIERAELCLEEAKGRAPGDLRISLARMLQSISAEDWEQTAEILLDTADAMGNGAVADGMRFRASYILLDRVGDASRAVDVVTPVLDRRSDFVAAQDLVRSAHRQLGGTAILDTSMTARGTDVDVRRDFGDSFAQLIREAELLEYRVGDPAQAVGVYRKALAMRPGDPVALLGFEHAARTANQVAELADVALAELKAIDAGDSAAKARAYTDLARIDSELRADADSAVFSLKAAVDAEPGYMPALRGLERAYGARASWSELYGIYGRLISILPAPADAAALALERARVGKLANQSAQAISGDYRYCYERNPRSRRALFALETATQSEGASLERAELEVAIAESFAADERARAAFYCLAAETFDELGSTEAAIDHYRLALSACSDYEPALAGWRRAALAAERWDDLAEAARRQAELEGDGKERARLLHLAAVALMDRALHGDRAVELLREVMALDPQRRDAVARLRLLFDEEGRHDDLVALLEERAELEDDLQARLELHHAAAKAYRTLFDDRDNASRHLRAMLELDPDHLGAIADLSDIAWEQGEWAEAAETLIQRARIETDPGVLRNIFYRLGTIYADRLPDERWAIRSFEKVLSYDEDDVEALARLADLYARTEDWKQALGACERLIKAEKDPVAKIDHLHRAAKIYVNGFQDASRAEQALRIALDLDPTNEKALAAVIEFFEGLGDNRGLRVQLDRVAAAMRSRLHGHPLDGVAYRILARIFARRAEIGVRGSRAAAYCAAEVAELLGAAEESEREIIAASRNERPKLAAFASTELDDYLFPRAVSSPLRELYRALGERIARRVGIDLRNYGVGRNDRLAPGNPAVRIIQEVANEMKLGELEVYVSKEQPTVAVAEPTSPISVVIGEALLTPDRPLQLRFLAGRCLKLVATGLAVPARISPRDFGLLTAGLIRQFQPDFTVRGLDAAAIAEESAQQKRLVPANLQQELAPFAVGVAGTPFEPDKAHAALHEAGYRAGLLACGSARAAIAAALTMGGYRDIRSAAQDLAILHLLRFAISEDYTVMRAALER